MHGWNFVSCLIVTIEVDVYELNIVHMHVYLLMDMSMQ